MHSLKFPDLQKKLKSKNAVHKVNKALTDADAAAKKAASANRAQGVGASPVEPSLSRRDWRRPTDQLRARRVCAAGCVCARRVVCAGAVCAACGRARLTRAEHWSRVRSSPRS